MINNTLKMKGYLRMSDKTLFQYCQKIVLFSESGDAVLLARRKGEADFDGTFSFIGGKMETTDGGIAEGIKREKTEEIGKDAEVYVYTRVSYNEYFIKASGQAMVLPHYYAEYRGGEIELNDEYSEYAWVKLSELHDFQPKISTIEPAALKALDIKKIANKSDMVRI
jgi:ADP-ribose pyrophosphatase YjhB (NUDIX family)